MRSKRNTLAILMVILLFVVASVPMIRITKNPPTKTYEQGLWEGHQLTIKYLKHEGLFNDTIQLKITEIDSVLHSKQ